MLNEILLRRKNKVILNAKGVAAFDAEKDGMVMAFCKNIEAIGFCFSSEVILELMRMEKEDLVRFYKETMRTLKKKIGADKEYTPMYPNFPHQVIEASDVELFFNAVIHYLSFGTLAPDYKKEERFPLFESTDLTTISLGTEDDVWEIFENLIASKTSISDEDKADLVALATLPQASQHLPSEIPFKENVAVITTALYKCGVRGIEKYFKTPTDVLRFVVFLNGGDVSLASPTAFHLKRKDRRAVMFFLKNTNCSLEDFYRHKNMWLRLGEVVHPFEFGDKYAAVKDAFFTLRNEKKPAFYGAKLADAINNKETRKSVDLLVKRPGDFARNLDKVLRDADDTDIVLQAFASVADKVSSAVLLGVREHFKARNENTPYRVFFPKGQASKAFTIVNSLEDVPSDVCDTVVAICEDALMKIYRTEKEPMGRVYVSDVFDKFIVPFSQRNSSSANKIITRGSRLPIKEGTKVVRPFIWWTNRRGGLADDIDLSAVAFNENWRYLATVSYYHLTAPTYGIYHSGDIVNGGPYGGKGVAEFVDIDIEKAREAGARYICISVNSYTEIPFNEMECCSFGFMERKAPQSGEIFEPKTVEMNAAITSPTKVATPVIFDLETNEFIWADMAFGFNSDYRPNNVASNLERIVANCFAIANCQKPSLKTLITLNAKARGELTDDKDDADIVFDIEGENVITPYDIDYFMGMI